ncbi:MAG: hypothetical protein AB9897_00080 [Anaerolineaceae bacterium]
MQKMRLTILLVALMFLISSCRLITPISPTPTLSASTKTEELLPESTSTSAPISILPSPTPQPHPTITPTPFLPIQGTFGVDNFKLRTGPGFLFDTIALYKANGIVQVYGRSPGNGWFFVTTSDHYSGWMKSDYINLEGDLEQIPYFGIGNANMVSGHVRNSNGEPMSKLGIVLHLIDSSSPANDDNTLTDESGTFYLFTPLNIKGNYLIGINAVDCTSNAVDSQCAYLYGFPSAQTIELPHPSDISIEFVLPNL